MILDHPTASGQILARPFKYSPEADSALSDLKVNKVEVRHYLRDGNVVLSHDKTKPRENPKQYYIEEEINRKDYFVVVAIYPSYTLVKEFGALAN